MGVKYTPKELRSNKKLDSWTDNDTDDEEEELNETAKEEKEPHPDTDKDDDGNVVIKGRGFKGVVHDGNTDKK